MRGGGLQGLWALWLALAACSHRGAEVDLGLEKALSKADALYAARLQPAELDAALLLLEGLRAGAPDDPRVLWRLVRAYEARGYARPSEGFDDYSTGLERGFSCLRLDPAFAALVAREGGMVDGRAVSALEAPHPECLRWTALTWMRWLEAHGAAGAAVDLEPARLLAELAAKDLYDPLSQVAVGLGWSIVPPPLGADLEAATSAFKRAVELTPGDLTPRVDLAEHVFGPLGEEESWRKTLEAVAAQGEASMDAGPGTLENHRAIQRAKALLREGPPRPKHWLPKEP